MTNDNYRSKKKKNQSITQTRPLNKAILQRHSPKEYYFHKFNYYLKQKK